LTKITPEEKFKKILEVEYEKGKIDTLVKITEGIDYEDVLPNAAKIISNISAMVEDLNKKNKIN